MIHMVETQVKEHILSKKLPVDLDNRLYSMIHLIGGLEFKDIIRFANNASFDEVTDLQNKVQEFPSTVEEIMPYVGGFTYLRDSKEYNEILDMIRHPSPQDLYEDIEVGDDGFYTTDTHPYFTKYITPELKKILFKMWDKKGKPSYTDLKLLGVDSSELFKDSHFANVPDIIMPVLIIEWLGGVQNTEFAQNKEFREITHSFIPPLKFKVEPIGYDYSFDEQENFGDAGYSCWHIKISIDKNSMVSEDYIQRHSNEGQRLPWINHKIGRSGMSSLTKGELEHLEENVFTPAVKITDLFPPPYLNKETSFREYTDPQMELIEHMWETYADLACEQFCSFCNVEVVLV